MRLPKPFSLKEIAALSQCEFKGDGDTPIAGLASLDKAKPDELSFARSNKFMEKAVASKAGALLVPADFGEIDRPLLIVPNVDIALAKIGMYLLETAVPKQKGEIHPTAAIDPTAKIGANVKIGANAVIAENAELADNVQIGAGSFVGEEVVIGEGSRLDVNVSVLWRTQIGKNCYILPGAIIGSDGFGFMQLPDGSSRKLPQLGIVIIEDNVEIGANTCIDRALLDATIISKGVKLDNLIHIAHNVELSENVLAAAQVGIAGSTVIGRNSMLGGQSGVVDHTTLGEGVRVNARTMVHKDFPDGIELWGVPAKEKSEATREYAAISKIEKMRGEIRKLKSQIKAIEGKI